eukprot:g61922.t1
MQYAADTEEWYAKAPKQYLFNAFQNAKMGVPNFNLYQMAGGWCASLTTVGKTVTGAGRSQKDAENACALMACRVLNAAGRMTRQVSAKQRSKGKKKRGGGGGGGGSGMGGYGHSGRSGMQYGDLPILNRSGHPFVMPFAAVSYCGEQEAKPKKAKSKVMGNGRVPHLAMCSQNHLLQCLTSPWAVTATEDKGTPPPPEPYYRLEQDIGERAIQTLREQQQAAWSKAQGGTAYMATRHHDSQRPQHSSWKGPLPTPPNFPPEAIEYQRAQYARNQQLPQVQQIWTKRRQLPVLAKRSEVLAVAARHRCVVSVVGGETGSGKTTQVPQFLLDHMLDDPHCRGGRILVTQPRRIAAISVAARVAQERGERLGESVGFQVALEKVLPTAPCSIVFCTTGILLRQLSSSSPLQGIAHIVVDEVHERDLNTDFLLVLLARLLRACAASSSAFPLRVTLMSATLDIQLFASYFSATLARPDQPARHVPTLEVQGKMYPVQELYLENILGYVNFSTCPVPKRKVDASQRQSITSSHREDDPQISRQLLEEAAQANPSAAANLRSPHCEGESVSSSVIAAVISWLCVNDPLAQAAPGGTADQAKGAILVFLPGSGEIRDVQNELSSSLSPWAQQLAGRALVLPLHGQLSLDEQQRVFLPAPAGSRKVVLATNVAESSVTIDDVVYVVNTGKVKEKRYDGDSGVESLYDGDSGVESLLPTWCSKANNKQRRGRAGRVREGLCIHLFVSSRLQHMRDFQLPEMRRVPLESLCLQILQLGIGRCRDVLREALEPPASHAVGAALSNLHGLGAVDEDENLTNLGRFLAQLPLEPRIGKMLVLAHALGMLSPALTLAASSQMRDPFLRPLSARDESDAARRKLGGGMRSDHFVLIRAFEAWQAAAASGRSVEREWCEANFVSWKSMGTIQRARAQLQETLQKCGLSGDGDFFWRRRFQHASSASRDSLVRDISPEQQALLHCVLVGSLWPNVALVDKVEQTRSKEGASGYRLIFHTDNNFYLHGHPSSTVSSLREYEVGPFTVVCFQTKVLTSALFIDSLTMVHPLTALLFGPTAKAYAAPVTAFTRQLGWHPQEAVGGSGGGPSAVVGLVQDGWMAVTAQACDALDFLRLHQALDNYVDSTTHEDGFRGGDGPGADFVSALASLLVACTTGAPQTLQNRAKDPSLAFQPFHWPPAFSGKLATPRQPPAMLQPVADSQLLASASVSSSTAFEASQPAQSVHPVQPPLTNGHHHHTSTAANGRGSSISSSSRSGFSYQATLKARAAVAEAPANPAQALLQSRSTAASEMLDAPPGLSTAPQPLLKIPLVKTGKQQPTVGSVVPQAAPSHSLQQAGPSQLGQVAAPAAAGPPWPPEARPLSDILASSPHSSSNKITELQDRWVAPQAAAEPAKKAEGVEKQTIQEQLAPDLSVWTTGVPNGPRSRTDSSRRRSESRSRRKGGRGRSRSRSRSTSRSRRRRSSSSRSRSRSRDRRERRRRSRSTSRSRSTKAASRKRGRSGSAEHSKRSASRSQSSKKKKSSKKQKKDKKKNKKHKKDKKGDSNGLQCRNPSSILAACPRLRVETASTQTGPFKVFRRANTLSMNY